MKRSEWKTCNFWHNKIQ